MHDPRKARFGNQHEITFRPNNLLRESAGKGRKWLLLAAITLIALPSTRLVNAQGGIFYTVNTTSDTVVVGACQNGNPGCSLRGAIQTANSHPGIDGIGIDLPAGSVINLTGVLPDITEGVSINGPGADKLTVRRNSGGEYRIFTVIGGITATFSGLTVSNGHVFGGFGGGIQNNGSGTVNMTSCTVSGNSVSASGSGSAGGGGILNNSPLGTLNMTNCTVSGNSATPGNFGGNSLGGGIVNDGTMNLINCTVSGNSALSAGGIDNNFGTANVTNCTISGNSTSAGSAGGIFNNTEATLNIKSSVVALNTALSGGQDFFIVSGSTVTSQGFNLVGKNFRVEGSFPAGNPNANNDIVGTDASPVDPKLDPNGLQNNGGPTKTIALLSGSPAIDKGTSNGLTGTLTTDQRGVGFPRTADYSSVPNATGGDGTDIGAVEFWTLKITSIAHPASGHVVLQGVGIPSHVHTIQASPDLSPNSFGGITTVNANGTGALQYDDADAIGLTKRFYRLSFP
jgi:CSLREA domain-containing protein